MFKLKMLFNFQKTDYHDTADDVTEKCYVSALFFLTFLLFKIFIPIFSYETKHRTKIKIGGRTTLK